MGLSQHDLRTLYLAHAASDHAAAGGEVLDNVRQKHLVSAATWEGLDELKVRVA